MKKKMIIVGIILIVVIIFLGGWYFMFCHMGIGPAFPFLPSLELDSESTKYVGLAADQLMTLVETKEEAEAIAQQYGIELTYFSEGVATFRTDEEPQTVIDRGEKNGYPKLYLNRTVDLMDK